MNNRTIINAYLTSIPHSLSVIEVQKAAAFFQADNSGDQGAEHASRSVSPRLESHLTVMQHLFACKDQLTWSYIINSQGSSEKESLQD